MRDEACMLVIGSSSHGVAKSLVRTGMMAPLTALLMVLAACNSTPNRAPVEDRAGVPRSALPQASAAASAASDAAPLKPLPGAENAGKPGYYTVKPGDTLIRIGLDNGQNWKDLVRWNSLDNPNVIEVGQVLRVVAPGTDPNAASTRGVGTAKVDSRPLEAKASAPAASGTSVLPPPQVMPPTPPPVEPVVAKGGDDDVNWSWPASAPVSTPFEEGKVKGLVFAGKAGDPVLAAADGRVVYAGSGLRGYGNLVILKHNNTYLTAYAHNQLLLVKEDQNVKRGQKIAEMGATDADKVQLHFEIRKLGKPVDPARLLPPR